MTSLTTVTKLVMLITLVNSITMSPIVNDKSLITDNTRSISCKSLKRTREKDGSCGECMEWFESENISRNEECTPIANVTIPMHELNAFIPNGSTVILECKFDSYQTCNWKRDDSNIGEDHKYRYIGPNKGINTKDCSLQIVNFTDFEAGDWICRGMATSDSSGPFGTQVTLSNENIVTARNRSTTYVEIGESIALKCYFEEPVNCAWYRYNESVEINNRYSYIASNSSGINTRDCSIKIKSLKDIDIVNWKCKSMATSSKNDTLSAILRLRKINTTEVIPGPITPYFVTIGEHISLNCKFDEIGNCNWNRNGIKLDVINGYKYNSKDMRSTDCSIDIAAIGETDLGKWICSLEDFTDIEPSAISWSIRKRTPSTPKISLSKQIGQDENIICSLDNGMSETNLQWQLDGTEIAPLNKKQLRNSDNALYDLITLKYSEELFKNISLLSCVAQPNSRYWKDEITIAEVKRFMTEQPEGNSQNQQTNAGTTPIVIIAVLAAIAIIAMITLVYYKASKMRNKTLTLDKDDKQDSGNPDPVKVDLLQKKTNTALNTTM